MGSESSWLKYNTWMHSFKFLIPDQIIFKVRSLITNANVSLWFDVVSIEEGWGSQGDHLVGKDFGVANKTLRVCKPKLVNRMTKKFNKP